MNELGRDQPGNKKDVQSYLDVTRLCDVCMIIIEESSFTDRNRSWRSLMSVLWGVAEKSSASKTV